MPWLTATGARASAVRALSLPGRLRLQAAVSISEYYDRDRTAFYAAIQGIRQQGMDLTGWLDYFVDGLATQMDEVRERGQRVTGEM